MFKKFEFVVFFSMKFYRAPYELPDVIAARITLVVGQRVMAIIYSVEK